MFGKFGITVKIGHVFYKKAFWEYFYQSLKKKFAFL